MLPPISFAKRQMHARPLACFAVFFMFGLILQSALDIPVIIPAALGISALTAGFALRKRNIRADILFMTFALCLGFVRMGLVDLPAPQAEDMYSVEFRGEVVSQPYIKQETGRLIMQFRIDERDGMPDDSTVRLYLRGDEDDLGRIEYGQTLSVFGHIWAADPITNPHEFDFGAYLLEEGMNAYATAKIEDTRILSVHKDMTSLLITVRSRIFERIDALFPENTGVARALLLADRSMLDDDIRDSFSKTGVTHLICISGMHVSVLATAILFLLRRIMDRKHAVAIALSALLVYGVLIGFTASFVRALIMFVIFSWAPIAGYPSDGITRLCCALFVTLLIAPMQIGDGGFILSYSATAGILLLYPALCELFGLTEAIHKKPPANHTLRLIRRFVLYFPQLLCATLSAQIASLPAIIALFGVQPIISVPINLICVPLCMLGYPIALAALLISAISLPLGTLLAHVPEMLFTAFSEIALHGASLPVTGVRIGKYPVILILLHSALILASSQLSRIRISIRKFLPLALIPVAVLSSLFVYISGLGYSIVFLNAEQADCAVIRTEGHTYLVDAGKDYTPAADYLDNECLSLDGIFLSHPDIDHAGGLTEILSVMRPNRIYIPEGWYAVNDISDTVLEGMALAERMNVEIVELRAGDVIGLSRNTKATVYAPAENLLTTDSNALSMVLFVEHEGLTALFTGDIPSEYEPCDLPRADVLKIAHHGARESTSPQLLEDVQPAYAVISVGENKFGHPSEEVLDRLQSIHANILRTDRLGAITISPSDDGLRIDTYLPMEE
ncbi:MAG: DNA internalization-related competence protein ComEC/Rec2 [Clostridiales bacterium]|nr:DNA internalization-related competence protein ComEC/Rec2 [Clostridiales bacterium]